MSTYHSVSPTGPGSIRVELLAALVAEAARLRNRRPADDDEALRLEQLLSLWRDGFRGRAPCRLPPEPVERDQVEIEGALQ